ncbi:hypothetical protein H4P1_00017 (plasmid) [Variovorax sp. PBS-H4]|nr:hypothetical protein H4P1_00017 [Variovorax sp. PBS-H4]
MWCCPIRVARRGGCSGHPRLQGFPAAALVEFAGIPSRISYPAAQLLTVQAAR